MTGYFLRSPRLGLRWWSATDGDLAAELWGNAEVTKLIGGPFSAEQVAARLARELATAEASGIQYWPVFLLASGDPVGCCGLRPYAPDDMVYELGFHLRPAHWGQGYAVEAGQIVLHYAFTTLKASALFAGHHPENRASSRVLTRLGFVYTHDKYYAPTGLHHPSYRLTADIYERQMDNNR